MINRGLLAVFVSISFALSYMPPVHGCGWWDPTGACGAVKELGDQTNTAIDKLKDELNKTRDALSKSAEVVAKAVPGERWARLVDGLGSTDPKVREETKQFLLNLAGNTDKPIPSTYKLVVGFDFDETKPFFHVDFGRFSSPDRSYVEAFVQQHSATLDATPKRTNLAPLSEAQLRTQLLDHADKLFAKITGFATPTSTSPNSTILNCDAHGEMFNQCVFLTFNDSLLSNRASVVPITNVKQAEASKLDRFKKQLEEAKSLIVEFALMAYSYKENRMDNLESSRDWSLVDGRTFVVVVIDKETYDTHNEDWTFKIRVQQADRAEVSLYNRPTQILKRVNFDPQIHKPVVREDGRTVYWAYVEMTGD